MILPGDKHHAKCFPLVVMCWWWQCSLLIRPMNEWGCNTILWCIYRKLIGTLWTYRIAYEFKWWAVYVLTRRLFWCLFPELRRGEINNKITSREHIAYVHNFISFTTYESINDDKNTDPYTSTLFLTRPVYVQLMTSINCWWCHNSLTIVTLLTWACGKWYLTS